MERIGIDAFIDYLCRQAGQVVSGRMGSTQFIGRVAEDCSNLRVREIARPLVFLRQVTEVPSHPFDATGFRPGVVDDELPARHYIAFLAVGYWLPAPLALLVLYLWEIAGFVRYRGLWSRRDLASGKIGIRHGRYVHSLGPAVLPGLVAGELAQRGVRPSGELPSAS